MSASNKIIELRNELRSLKTAYAQAPYDLILYTYNLDVDTSHYFIYKTVVLDTEDGSNALATIEGAMFERMPYEGGAKFFLISSMGDTVKLISMQKGDITIYDSE